MKSKNVWWHHGYCGRSNDYVIMHSLKVFILEPHSFLVEQWHCCNPSSAIDPHQILAWWFFVIIAGLSAQCVNTSWLWGATSSPDGTDTVLENSTPFCKGTHSLTMLVCTLYWPWWLNAKTKVNLLFVLLTCRFEENLSSPPLYEHSTELLNWQR